MQLYIELLDHKITLTRKVTAPGSDESELVEVSSVNTPNGLRLGQYYVGRWIGDQLIERIRELEADECSPGISLHVTDNRKRPKFEHDYECKPNEFGSRLIITQPGRFEGEPIWVPYFTDLMSEGAQTGSWHFGDNETYDYFEIDQDDLNIFPELARGGDCTPDDPCVAVVLSYRSDGFVCATHYNKAEWEREKAHMEHQLECEEDANEESNEY